MYESLNALTGFQLVPCESCKDIIQVRRHKKKRINKKWLKRYGTKEVPWRKFYVAEDGYGGRMIIAHPTMIDFIVEYVRNRDKSN